MKKVTYNAHPKLIQKGFQEKAKQTEEKIIGNNLLGYDMVNSYFCAIKELSSFQNFDQNSKGLKDDLKSFRVKI